MSRRCGKFEHHPFIFEGVSWAYFHLGGATPRDLRTKAMDALNPLMFPLADNERLRVATKKGKGAKTHNDNTGVVTGTLGDGNPA